MTLLTRRRSGATAARNGRRPGRLRRAVLLWGTVGTVLAAALVFLFFFSAAFVVKEVVVEGVEGDFAASVRDAAQIPNGRPLARVSEDRVRERVMEDARISELRVERGWPSTVTLHVAKREAALVLRHGAARWFADDSGVVFGQVHGKAAEAAADGLPQVRTQRPPQELEAGEVAGVLEVWSTRPSRRDLGSGTDAVTLDRDGEVTVSMGLVTVHWGEPVESEQKWAVIRALLRQDSIDPFGEVPLTIDVQLPDQPVVTGLPEAQGD